MDEKTFLKQYDSSKYEKPSVTADLVIFAAKPPLSAVWDNPLAAQLKVLLIRRGKHPFQGCYALPGGFANPRESLLEAAARELLEETGVEAPGLEQIGTYSDPGRDPRGWVITTAFRAFLPEGSVKPVAADDAKEADWFSVSLSPEREIHAEEDGETITERQWKLTLTREEEHIKVLTRERITSGPLGRRREISLLDRGGLAFDHGLILTEALLRG